MRQKIQAPPLQPTFAIDALEVAHQVHMEEALRRHRRRPHPRRGIGLAGCLDKSVEVGFNQRRLQTIVEYMTRQARHLRPADHQIRLAILLLSHRHCRLLPLKQGLKELYQRTWILTYFTAKTLFAHKARPAPWCGATTRRPQYRERARDRGLRWGKAARRVRCGACPMPRIALTRADRFATMK